MELFQISCPCCQGLKCSDYSMYETKCDGARKLVQCSECDCIFSETTNTLLFNLKTSVSRIALVLKSRTEGLSFNATCRTFNIGTHTLSLDFGQNCNLNNFAPDYEKQCLCS